MSGKTTESEAKRDNTHTE